MKGTKIDNARAQLLFCSLHLLFGNVLVGVAVVVCLSSLSLRWLNRVMQDHEARASDPNRKLIFSFFLLFS